ncbi:hypothetical protein V6N11_082560 [Hibiscus sabdariffa]|uniref:Uncharacterized protein n=1 Tax=Hibiscus sabdariffa TaxID=183260 RepID=A0ABR2N9A3_9ROSI
MEPTTVWILPLAGAVKFNVDGVFEDSAAGCGGVLRSSAGVIETDWLGKATLLERKKDPVFSALASAAEVERARKNCAIPSTIVTGQSRVIIVLVAIPETLSKAASQLAFTAPLSGAVHSVITTGID